MQHKSFENLFPKALTYVSDWESIFMAVNQNVHSWRNWLPFRKPATAFLILLKAMVEFHGSCKPLFPDFSRLIIGEQLVLESQLFSIITFPGMPEETFAKDKVRGKENIHSKQEMKGVSSLWASIKGFLGYILITIDIVLCQMFYSTLPHVCRIFYFLLLVSLVLKWGGK